MFQISNKTACSEIPGQQPLFLASVRPYVLICLIGQTIHKHTCTHMLIQSLLRHSHHLLRALVQRAPLPITHNVLQLIQHTHTP